MGVADQVRIAKFLLSFYSIRKRIGHEVQKSNWRYGIVSENRLFLIISFGSFGTKVEAACFIAAIDFLQIWWSSIHNLKVGCVKYVIDSVNGVNFCYHIKYFQVKKRRALKLLPIQIIVHQKYRIYCIYYQARLWLLVHNCTIDIYAANNSQ